MTQLETIYERYFKDVFLYVFSLCREQHLAEDITSETFMKALKSLDQFKGQSDTRVWLCQIAKNTYFSHLRKEKRTVEIENLPEPASNIALEQLLISSETSMKVHKIIHNLKEPYKE